MFTQSDLVHKMDLWTAILLGILIFIVILGIVIIVAWALIVAFYLPLTNDTGSTSVLGYAIADFLGELFSGFWIVPSSLIAAAAQIVSTLRENLPYIIALGVASTAGFVWLEYHPQLIKSYLIFGQCTFQPLMDNLVMPILNIIRILYNTVVGLWNFMASIFGFLRYGGYVTLFKCANSTLSITQLMAYIGVFLRALFNDFSTWIRGEPLFTEFNIKLSIEAFSNIFRAALPVLNCFCRGLNFLWIYLTTLVGLPSLAETINRTWIAFINVFQVPFSIIRTADHRPDFTNVTLNSCAAVIAAGDFVQEVVFLTAETLYGLITNETEFPNVVAAALSVRYTYIITHPICGAFRVVNMTLVAAANFRNIGAPNGTGVAYFQFGLPFDELKVAAFQLGDLVDIIDNAIPNRPLIPGQTLPNTELAQGQAFVTNSLYAIIDVFAFLFEWVIGNVFYLSFDGPLPASFGLYNQSVPLEGPANFWQFYFVDYWFKAIPFGEPVINPVDNSTITFPITLNNYTYSSALDSFFRNVFRASQALGDILGLFNVVLGQVVRHFVNIITGLVLSLANLISYSHCILTGRCGNMPITARNVNVDLFFNETLLFAGAAGDLFRQFDNASCTNNTGDANKTILCLSGEVVESTLDIFVLATREVVHFIQDVLTIPSGQLRFCLFETSNVSVAQCVRIPDFTTAITELDDDLCAFAYGVTSLIPPIAALRCPFSPEANVTRTCSSVQTCLGFEFCSILRFIPIILQIVNTLFIKILSGTAFRSIEEFFAVSVGLLVNQFGVVLEQFAAFLDCSICAAEGVPGGACPSPIFDIIHPVADAIRDLGKILTTLFLRVVQLLLIFIVSFFTGNPITAIIDFVVGFVENVFIGVGFAIIDFIDQLFQKIGLGFFGSFIKILYTGFCTVLAFVINAIIKILKVLSFGYFSHDYVQFCCTDGGCTPHTGSRKRMETPVVIGNVTFANMDNWLQILSGEHLWSVEDACNASITTYAETPFTTLSTYEYGEILFCTTKLVWPHRVDNRTAILPWTCDRYFIEKVNASFSSFTIMEQSKIMECAITRLFTDGVRDQMNISWLPQDILTNPLRTVYFAAGLMHGMIINAQFVQDKTAPPARILTQKYRDIWTKMHLDTSHYDKLHTVEEVILFQQHVNLRSYFDANQATEYDATLDVITGLWAIAGSLLNGFTNMTDAFGDNTTVTNAYLTYNGSMDNPTQAGLGSLFGLFGDAIGVLTNLTTYWSDPVNYKKRSEAYSVMSAAALTAYKASVRQVFLLAAEYKDGKVYESTHLYNQTCGVDGACHERVNSFRDAYEATMRGEDDLKGATSLVYKLTSWWKTVDFTVYPIQNPRYKDVRVRVPTPLYYTAADGSVRTETRWQRLWRQFEHVRVGTLAAQRRWAVANVIYETTRDKIYTQVLKHYYREKYTTSEHHFSMLQQHREMTGDSGVAPFQQPRGHKICAKGSKQCVTRYRFDTLAYEEHDTHLSIQQSQVGSILDTPCIRNISFTCFHPLQCDGNVTTTLCVQCYYLQALVDRSVAATDQVLTYYGPDGRYLRSLNIAFDYFDYSFNPNATVRVGDSPLLHVALFPAKGDGSFYDFIIQSARYIGDDTPNKTRFDQYIQHAESVLSNTSGVIRDVRQSSLFTRELTDINEQVFAIISEVFLPLLQFFYNVMLYLTNTGQQDAAFAEFLADDFLFCDWLVGSDLDGTKKHFSIGEMLALYALVIVASSSFTITLFGFDVIMLFLNNMIASTVFMSVFLTLYTNWAYLCSPALPVNLADDIFYFIAYNWLPKCSWYWGFMMDSRYDNENCHSCEVAREAVLTHCRHNAGFFDFTYNAAFIIDAFLPQFVNDIRTGTGAARIFLTIPFIINRLNFFLGVNLDDPFVWARFQGCNWIVTIWWNLLIFVLYGTAIIVIGFPIIGAVSTIFSWLWSLATKMSIIIMLILGELSTNPYLNPQYPDDGSITGNQQQLEQQQQAAADNNNTTTQGTAPLSRFFNLQQQQYSKEANGFQLSRLYNIVNFVKDNLIGDRKRK